MSKITFTFKGRTYTRRLYGKAEKVDDYSRWFCPRCKKLHIWKVSPPYIAVCKCGFTVLIDEGLNMLEPSRWRELVEAGILSKEPKKIDPSTIITELTPVEEIPSWKCPHCGSEALRWTKKAVYCGKCGAELTKLVETYPVRGTPLSSTELKGRYEIIEKVVLQEKYIPTISYLVWGEPYTFRKPYNRGYILYMTRAWILRDPKTREPVGYMLARSSLLIPSWAVQRYNLLLKYLGLTPEPYVEEVETQKPIIEPRAKIGAKKFKVRVERVRTARPEWMVEAALVSVGHGLTVTQLSLFTQLSPEDVTKALLKLIEANKVVPSGVYNNKEVVYILTYAVPPESAVYIIKMDELPVKTPRYVVHPATGTPYTAPPTQPPKKPPTPPVYKVPYHVAFPVRRYIIYPPAVWRDLKTKQVFVDYYPPESPSGEREQIQYLRLATREEFLHYLKTEKGRTTYESLKELQKALKE